jgi:osmotically inducible protein OsmC
MDRGAIAVWKGSGTNGKGVVSTDTGALQERRYSARSSFEQRGQDPITGTNPEELLGAAHAACFSMALALRLGEAGYDVNEIRTEARVHMEKLGNDWVISEVQLHCTAKVPRIDTAEFHELAHMAKVGCPISRALKTEIMLTTTLG